MAQIASVRHRLRPFRVLIAAPMVLLLTSPALVSVASHAQPSAKSLVDQGLSYYKGKTLTFVAPTAAGGPIDVIERIELPAEEKFLHATINVEDVPSGGSVPGQDMIASAPPNGLTFGAFELGVDAVDAAEDVPALNFNPLHEAFLGSTPTDPIVFDSLISSPYTKFSSLKTSSTPVKFPLVPGGSGPGIALAKLAFGLNLQFVTGYADSSAVTTGFLRGDGPVSAFNTASYAPLIVGNQLHHAFAISAPLEKSNNYYSLYKNTPLLSSFEKTYVKTATEKAAYAAMNLMNEISPAEWAVRGSVPAARVAALSAALSYALGTASVKNQLRVLGDLTGYVSGVSAKAQYVEAPKLIDRFVSFFKANGLG